MRKFFYLMAMVCTLGFFTACSSDDDPTIWDTFKGGEFQTWGDALTVDDDDVDYQYVDYKINVSRVDDTKAKVVINAATEGINIATITVPEALIEQKGTDVVISGEGTRKFADDKAETKATASSKDDETMKVKVTLTISNDNKANLELEADGQKYTASSEKTEESELAGTWTLHPVTETKDYAMYRGAFEMTWEVEEGSNVTIMGFLTPETASDMATGLVNQLLPTVLESVTFTSDGKIYAKYAENEKDEKGNITKTTWKVADGYATYKLIADNLMYVYLDNDKILSTVSDATAKATLKTILDQFKDGIPVKYEYRNNNKSAFFYVDKEFATELAENTVLKGIVENLGDEDLGGFGATIKYIVLQDLPGAMKNTTKFQAGIVLDK